jgi:gluconate 2-dehydrogenase gamma chain
MKRRDSLKLLATGALAGAGIIAGCKPGDAKKAEVAPSKFNLDRAKEEQLRDEKLMGEQFFTPHEMATIAVLADIIIPADEISGSATQAKVPEFIEFIVKDMPQHQLPMRGGLKWVDMYCFNKWEKAFKDCSEAQQIELVKNIAYPEKAPPNLKPGVKFFSLMRNLTASGFYTSEIGVKDIGYQGNTPNQWKGVPDEVLKQYNLSYSEKELKECIQFDTNNP